MGKTKDMEGKITTANNLPEKQNILDTELVKFNEAVSIAPNPAWIKINKFANNARYIPIRIIENLLRTVFGVYQTEFAGEPKIMGNSVVVHVHLKVYHPVLNQWITYAGIGAVPIELEAQKVDQKTGQIIREGARHNLDFEKINSKALHKNVPAALSFAISNAAKKIGRIFGSDLNDDENSTIYNKR
jgi:hypothetical protein